MRRRTLAVASALLGMAIALAGCGGRAPVRQRPSPADVRSQVARMLPATTTDRAGWAADIQSAFAALDLEPSRENLCAVVAVTAQESGTRADPAVPNLGRIARAEIEQRAARHHVPALIVDAALRVDSPDGRTYGARIAAAHTERELNAIYEDLIGSVPLGSRLFAGANPVRTAGPMQVSVAFAEHQVRERRYPYASTGSVRHDLFTRRGGLYFGVAHLLDYPAPYDRLLYRFADFNAGRYASRNAAFQSAVEIASGVSLALDGDLIARGGDTGQQPGATERAVRSLAPRLHLADDDVRHALEQGEGPDFERTDLYRRVFALAEATQRRTLPRAVVPQIALSGPKISHRLTTAWYADRVDRRFRACMAPASAPAAANRTAAANR